MLNNYPRDSWKIDFFGKQLNKINFSKECCTKAVAEPLGQLLIDMDAKTS